MSVVYTDEDLNAVFNLYFHERNVTRKKKLSRKIERICKWRREHGIRFVCEPVQLMLSAKHLYPPIN